ncbi:hypothetical protein BaRGS_00012584 [Batillaria attramentaria]|uniref:Uncharacterized protein n=1 Tax=Batillaria attramentaria TaxID=370345 RepID=A0ABD0L9U6_9CAEN
MTPRDASARAVKTAHELHVPCSKSEEKCLLCSNRQFLAIMCHRSMAKICRQVGRRSRSKTLGERCVFAGVKSAKEKSVCSDRPECSAAYVIVFTDTCDHFFIS